MQWRSSISDKQTLEEAIRDAVEQLGPVWRKSAPDLAIVFLSNHYLHDYERLPELIANELPSTHLIGCSSGGVIGAGKEIEQKPGLSLTVAKLPDVEISTFHFDADDLNKNAAESDYWKTQFAVDESLNPAFLLIPEPFSFDSEKFLEVLDSHYPNAKKVGGLASGATQPGFNVLYLDGKIYRSGIVGLILSGDIVLETVVAQGCRPIGSPMFVTKADGGMLMELDCISPRQVLADIYRTLPPRDRELFHDSLSLGIVMRPGEREYQHGDFLIRDIVGMDADTGYLAIDAPLENSQVVQFHLRDAASSREDLEMNFTRYADEHQTEQPEGALLFSCLGRGSNFYGQENHDSNSFKRRFENASLGGFFCNGEIGPVQGTTFVHGYTSAFGLFRSGS